MSLVLRIFFVFVTKENSSIHSLTFHIHSFAQHINWPRSVNFTSNIMTNQYPVTNQPDTADNFENQLKLMDLNESIKRENREKSTNCPLFCLYIDECCTDFFAWFCCFLCNQCNSTSNDDDCCMCDNSGDASECISCDGCDC